MSDAVDEAAQRIAGRGRDALVARLRPAFEHAVNAHADVLTVDEQRLEQMIQTAADRADGLQWRRALAGVASEELGIELAEALMHPAVARAQALVGAPSYEGTLARYADPDRGAAAAGGPAVAPVEREGEAVEPVAPEAKAVAPEGEAVKPEAEPVEPEAPHPEPVQPEPEPAPPAGTPGTLRMAAIHLGGIANLKTDESGLELRLSADGLDIARGGIEVLGRITWEDMRALEVAAPRSVRRRRKSHDATLRVRTRQGEATFQIPALSPEELRGHLDPVVARHLGR